MNTEKVREQAKRLGFHVAGDLIRYPAYEQSKFEQIFMDSEKNEYLMRNGVLTIIAKGGEII